MADAPLKKRANDGRFKPGNTASQGRPKGSRNKRTALLEQTMAEDGEAVVRAMIDKAREGDVQAARIVLDRIMPVRKGRPVEVALPALDTPTSIVTALDAVAQAMAGGVISPEEAKEVAAVLEVQRKAVEMAEIEQRLAAIEERVR